MPETVFWDTSAFVALGNADDDLHEEAVQVSDALARQKARILTTSAVLTEVANTFSRSGWRPVAHQLVESVRQSAVMGVTIHGSPTVLLVRANPSTSVQERP